MLASRTRTFLRITTTVVALLLVSLGGTAWWLSKHYKQLIRSRLPKMVAQSTDSIYHISIDDISISIRHHQITLTGVKVWADERQADALRARHHSIPPTLSTVTIPRIEAYGIAWGDLLADRTLSCGNVVVHDLNWRLLCHPHPGDSLFTRGEKNKPTISKITSDSVHFINPDITYRFNGIKRHFDCKMRGGSADLNKFVYNSDHEKDTSLFLYAGAGKVRFKEFEFSKLDGRYVTKTPNLDFETDPSSATLKSVKIKEMANNDPQTGKTKEVYNIDLPQVELNNFNWNKLIYKGVLRVPKCVATSPSISIRYIRENNPVKSRKGGFPNQLLLQVGLKTSIHELGINKGYFKYSEITKKGAEGTIEFTGIDASFENITNLPDAIEKRKSCEIKLKGKFMNKSDISVTFKLPLTDSTGRYSVDGYVTNLDGKDVTPQAQVFTIVKVTSFHLDRMNMHIEGDETYGKGEFTVNYKDLKISLFKFDTKMREGKKGLFAFVGSALVLYPSNPMHGKDLRKVATSFARDTTKGFTGTLWQHMFRAAKKTAVREKAIVTLTDGPETQKGDKPKKGILKRLFGKKKAS